MSDAANHAAQYPPVFAILLFRLNIPETFIERVFLSVMKVYNPPISILYRSAFRSTPEGNPNPQGMVARKLVPWFFSERVLVGEDGRFVPVALHSKLCGLGASNRNVTSRRQPAS